MGIIVLGCAILIVRATCKQRGVIERNRIFAERLVRGTDPYEGGLHTPYPLAWALFHAAFLPLPERAARAVWAALQVGLLALLLHLLWRTVRAEVPSLGPRRDALLLLTLLITSRYWIRDTAGGGSNILIVTLTFLGLYGYLHCRENLGALPLALACALKLTPLLFVPYFLLKRAPGFALRVVGLTALFLASPMLVTGPERFLRITARWAGGILGFLAKGDLADGRPAVIPFEWMNQSLRNALFRYLTPCGHPHPLYVDALRLSPVAAAWAVRGVLAALVILAAWLLRRRHPREEPLRYLTEISLVYLLALLLSPITWRAHYVASIPAVLLLCAHALGPFPGRRATRILLVLAFLLGGATSEFFWGKGGKDLLQAYYTVTLSGILLAVGLARLLSGPARLTRTPTS